MLTQEEVKALRKAHDVVYTVREGIAEIKVITQRETDIYKEQSIVIPVEQIGRETKKAAYVDMCTNTCPIYKTFASFIKAEDDLNLRFYKDALTNGAMKEHGLHGDKLELHVFRGKKRYAFFIGAACTYNNSGRMIQE